MLNRRDGYAILLLLLGFAPFYLACVDVFPYRVNFDEIETLNVQKVEVKSQLNPLGLMAGYDYHPRLMYLVEGWVAQRLGQIDLRHSRQVSAFAGLMSIAISFLLFRASLPFWGAVGASVILGSSNSLIVLSRMAIWNNTAFLIEVSGLALLCTAFYRRQIVVTFLGGVVCGFSFYTYAAGRISLVMAGIFYWACIRKRAASAETIRQYAGVAFLGALLSAAPMIFISAKTGSQAFDYTRRQILLFREARVEQKEWSHAKTERQGIQRNILRGLAAFNSRMRDVGNTYPNPWTDSNGFLEPLTGVFLWLGLWGVWKGKAATKNDRTHQLFMGAGFVVYWFLCAFILNKAPCYARLLPSLPFVAYLATKGIYVVTDLPIFSKFKTSAACLGVVAIVFSNVFILTDVMKKNMERGDVWTAVRRYMAIRNPLPTYAYYIIGDVDRPYTYQPYYWKLGMPFFAGEHQSLTFLPDHDFSLLGKQPPFALFMNKDVWLVLKPRLEKRFGGITADFLRSDKRVVAVEILNKHRVTPREPIRYYDGT